MNGNNKKINNDWMEFKLGDVVHLVKDSYKPKIGDHLPYIGLEHIQAKSLRLLSIGDSDSVISQKYRFNKNDILFGKLRPYFRKVIKPNFAGVCSTDIWVINSLEGFDQNFMFYFFANQEFVDTSNFGDSGSKMPRADWDYIKDTTWQFPPLPQQRAIAGVLSSLDDMIDLLHRQNKTLEAMAETLFTHMFISNNEKWPKCNLSEHIKVYRGLSYKGSDLCTESEGIPMHNLNSIYEGGGYKYPGIKYYKGEFKERHKTKPGDVIVANTEQGHKYLLIGYPAIVPKIFGNNGIFSQHIYKIEIKDSSQLTNAFLYYMLKNSKVWEQVIGAANGSTVNMLSPSGLDSATFNIPPKNSIEIFTQFANHSLEKQEQNISQSRTLTRLRDTLLPKLMSGELKVKF